MPQSMGELEYDQQPRNQERSPKKKEKKWTLGSLFRRKKAKESDSDSSDSDAVEEGKKGGFLARRRRRRAANRGSKDVSQSFEHVILRPNAGANVGTDVKKSIKARVEASRDSLLKDSSSEEECSPRTKTRAPRSKRSSRDMSDCNMKVMELDSSPRSPRWTAKVVYCESSDYDARYTAHTRSATPSPAQSPIAKVKHLKRPPIPQSNVPRPLHCQKSASFDILPRQSQYYQHPPTPTYHNHHHHQPPQLHTRVPPPPPPRDPQRKIIPPLGYQLDRPLSYAFESNQPLPKIMTDHNSNITAYKVSSSCSLDHQPVYKMSSSGSLDNRRNYQYYTDQQPRSRKPIHIARVDQPYLSDSQIGRVRTSDWRLPRDSNSSLCDSSDSREGGADVRPLSMVVETAEQQVQTQTQELPEKKELKRKSSNLEDALNELEAIYKTLQMRDEEPPSRGFESDSGCYRVVDDMAYRRLNRKESRGSPDCRRVMSQAGSYLLVSPTLSPPPFATAPPIPPPQNEPDVTLDDVVYRNIRHTNNSLKVADPQPPFGIPIGPVAPAPSSDYLHATPKQLYRPTFKPRKTPDIVKDDLAYRNLRKDGQHDSLLSTEDCLLNENPSILKKKRAVRSLSANLLSIIQKEQFRIENQNIKNFNYDDNFEKTQSYSDLPDIIDTRYKRSYSTEDSDATPRVSRIYPDIPISTTSTETLTDSRANIMIAQESCSSKNQFLPFTNKPLPKTDFAKLRLPSPNSHQISSPKKFVYGDNSAHVQNIEEKNKFDNAVDNQINCNPSPNNSLRTNIVLTPAERNNSKSPSPYYSACETPPLSNSNKFISTHDSGKNNLNSKNNGMSVNKHTSGEVNLRSNGISSPTSWRRGSLQPSENDTLSSSESRNYYNRNSGKLNHLSDQGFENRRCVSQSPRVDVQLVKSENYEKNRQSSSFANDLHNRPPDKIKKFNLEVKSPTQSTVTYGGYNVHDKNNFDLATLELAQEDLITDLEPVPLNPPKISIREGGTHGNQRNSKLLMPSRPLSVSNTGISSNSNKINPKVTENKISIEGIQLVIPTENKTSVGHNKTNKVLISPTEKSQQRVFSSPTVPSTSIKNAIRTPSPQTSHSHEKSHQDTRSSHSLYVTSSVETPDDQCKNTKTGVPRPWSSININTKSSEKLKETSPRPTSTMINENCGDGTRLSSPSSYLNPEKPNSKFQSSNPCLSVETKGSRLPSPHLSVTPDKSPVPEKFDNSSRNPIYLINTIDNDSSKGCTIVNTSDNLTRLQKCSQLSKPSLVVDESADNIRANSSSCSIVGNQPTTEILSKEISDDSLLKSRKLNELESKISGNSRSLNDSINILSSPSISTVSKEESLSLNNLSCQNERDDQRKTMGSSLKIEKDLNQLLTEINAKQGEILSGKAKNNSPSSHPTSVDKRDSLALGKINPHKPVKLTTFSINDNDTIENNETIIVPNRENEIIGTSESMTDLLRELTRSLDQDFGCIKEKENDSKTDIEYGEKQIERTINDTLEGKNLLHSNSKSSDSQELNNTDEADNEVMEINRSVLEQSEIKESKSDVKNGNNENLIGFVAVKGSCKTIGVKHEDLNQTRINEVYDKSAVLNESESTDIKDKQDYYSDDSNAEFVEEICKTASELSALSSTSKVTSTNGSISSQLLNSDSIVNTPMMTDKVRQSRPQQSQGGRSDQNEGICSSKMDCSPVIHPSGLIMFCTFCMAQLQQLVDLDFLTVLGLLIAIVSLILLLVL